MKTLNLSTPNAKAIKKSLKIVVGVCALRCTILNGKMYVTVKKEDSVKVSLFFTEYSIVHSSGVPAIGINTLSLIDFPNLMIDNNG